MAHGGGESESTLEFTPTWIVAAVCSLIVVISLAAERCLHYLGKTFKGKNQKALFEALLKVKEGIDLFFSAIYPAFSGDVQAKLRVQQLPVNIPDSIFAELMLLGFISLLLTVSQGMMQRICIPQEWTIYMLPCHRAKEHAELSPSEAHGLAAGILGLTRRRLLAEGPTKVTYVHQSEFIREHFEGTGRDSAILSWLHSFVKQFYGSVTKSDYATMRLGFIMLLLAVGTKLEHVITQLAIEVAEKHSAIEGDLVVNPSDEHFWFGRPKIVLYLIHFILFQNAFEIAFFFWILTTYGFNSCIMDHVAFIVSRLVIGAIIQLFCSYSTLPLYAIVTQMGTFFKKEIFDEHVQQSLVGWALKARKRKALKDNGSSGAAGSAHPFARPTAALEEGSTGRNGGEA
ncbi:MLO-like protein 1 [Dichanthelium oligosanthes]|uniref:MLO-like protein 1 n=1 Tax=Dichanthelium oligosanthes TaxID=888268 RepID=A0A1E5WH25_9POAL|nr:MLO-like protein 1 [Dichanthelium oligosanthes]